jgi:hypothetical protein
LDDKQLLNPVFMMWGFDSEAAKRDETYVREILAGHEIRDKDDPIWDIRPHDPWMCTQTNGLLELLLDKGRDVCMLIPDDATRELQSNALLMLKALDTVFAESPVGTQVPVIGFSAGGMIARWALLHLEDLEVVDRRRGLYPHMGRISSYVSYDTPHYGANVPPSIQMLMNYLADTHPLIFLLSGDAMDALRAINSPAACQLAWYHYGGVNPWGKHDVGPHPLRLVLAAELGGRWPVGIPRYAYANGPANWHLFGGAMPNTSMIQFGDTSLFDMRTLPDPNTGSGNDAFTIGPSWARLYWGWINRAEPLDSAPGSRTGFYNQVINGLNFIGRSGKIDGFLAKIITLAMPVPKPSCFVPTVSALHLSTSVWYDCVHNLVGRDHMHPPFERWQCAPDGVHERHVQITDASAIFVLSCLSE